MVFRARQRGKQLIYTAYFEESNTHGPSPTVIMACFLGHARQWELFGRRLRAIQRRDGFTIFHSTEFKGKKGAFAGWSGDKGMRLVHDLTELVRDNLTEGVTVHLEHERYLNEYRKPPVPKKMNLDSQYGVCFRACIAHLVSIVVADGKKHLLNGIIEEGHPNVGDTKRIFNEMKTRVRHRVGIDVLGTMRVAKKVESPPLMVSDFLAHSYSMMRASSAAGGLDYANETPMHVRRREAGLTFLQLGKDSLWRLKQNFDKERQEAAAAWRTRRDARKPAA
jgi:hypothetical protein